MMGCFLLPPPALQYVQYMEKKILWCAYWVGLGILSSVGLGTGLHTFLLYLVRGHLYVSWKHPQTPSDDQQPPRNDDLTSSTHACKTGLVIGSAAEVTSAVSVSSTRLEIKHVAFHWVYASA